MRLMPLWHAVRHFLKRKIALGFSIPPDALVLDVGSGDKPFWRANVFVDDLSMPDVERAGHAETVRLGVFVDGKAEALPFDDGTFDFVYCSHLLEHSNDPARVVSEILRVTKATGGRYIECPNALVEALLPFPGHRWMIFDDGDSGLVFLRQTLAQHDAAIRNRRFADKVLGMRGWNGYQVFIQKTFTKRDGLPVQVIDEVPESLRYESSELDAQFPFGATARHGPIVAWLRKLRRVDRSTPQLQALVASLRARGYVPTGDTGTIFRAPGTGR